MCDDVLFEVDNSQLPEADFDELVQAHDGLVTLRTVMESLQKTSLVVDVRNVQHIVKEQKLGQTDPNGNELDTTLDSHDFKVSHTHL